MQGMIVGDCTGLISDLLSRPRRGVVLRAKKKGFQDKAEQSEGNVYETGAH